MTVPELRSDWCMEIPQCRPKDLAQVHPLIVRDGVWGRGYTCIKPTIKMMSRSKITSKIIQISQTEMLELLWFATFLQCRSTKRHVHAHLGQCQCALITLYTCSRSKVIDLLCVTTGGHWWLSTTPTTATCCFHCACLSSVQVIVIKSQSLKCTLQGHNYHRGKGGNCLLVPLP